MSNVTIRILEHRFRIRNCILEAPMVTRFIEKNHSPEELKFCVLYKFESRPYTSMDISKELFLKEAYFIRKSQTLHPEGLHAELDLSPSV